MVNMTLPTMVFRSLNFLRASRLYSSFLYKCDEEGNFKMRAIKRNIKFYRNARFSASVKKCYNGLGKPNLIASCGEYCASLHPTKYNK